MAGIISMVGIISVAVQAPVVQKMDSAIHWMNCYPLDIVRKTNCAFQWIEIFT